MWTERRNLSTKTEESLPIRFIICQDFHLFIPRILTYNLNMCPTADKFMPHLSEEQEGSVNKCRDLQQGLGRQPQFFSKIITNDESQDGIKRKAI
jgi:hypothetical protein